MAERRVHRHALGKELRAAELGRALDDPGDAFFELSLTSRRLDALITVRTWVEVREVFLPGQAVKVNRFIRAYNGLRGKGDDRRGEVSAQSRFGAARGPHSAGDG